MTEIVRSVADLRAQVAPWHAAGDVVGVVPTMGALHEGHLSLVRAAQADCGRVIVTIFVNPRQFDRAEDLAKYPRTEVADAALLAPMGVDLVFAPDPAEVYPDGFCTTISVAGLAGRLEGQHRPGHFDGVATVVAKLFGMTGANRAYFGEKDWQQLQVVRRMVADLNLGITVIGCPTDRDPDGLARSSRNARLSAADRAQAAALPRIMAGGVTAMRNGADAGPELRDAEAQLLAAGFDRVDYLTLCDGATLAPLQAAQPGARLLAAAWLSGVRLIDNMPL